MSAKAVARVTNATTPPAIAGATVMGEVAARGDGDGCCGNGLAKGEGCGDGLAEGLAALQPMPPQKKQPNGSLNA